MCKLSSNLENLIKIIRNNKDRSFTREYNSEFGTNFYFLDLEIVEAAIKFIHNNKDMLNNFIDIKIKFIEGDDYGTINFICYFNEEEYIEIEFKSRTNILIWSEVKLTTFRKFFSKNNFNIGEENND
jgi:hypothetical protein